MKVTPTHQMRSPSPFGASEGSQARRSSLPRRRTSFDLLESHVPPLDDQPGQTDACTQTTSYNGGGVGDVNAGSLTK